VTSPAGEAAVTPAAAATGEAAPRARRGRDAVFALRLEEVVALAFLLPTTWLTLTAYVYAERAGVVADRYPGGVVRLAVAAALLAGLFLARRRWPGSRPLAAVRDVLPFLACVLIYTNLHDTIGFVNTRDVHWYLDALDRELLGVQPVVWAERLITPARTEVMSFFYLNFFWIAPSTSALLLLRGDWRAFRATTIAVIACFYLGYALYVLFPAAPPRLVLVYEFRRTLQGYPHLFSNLSARAFELLPVDSRAAFPSLHAAVSLVALVCAWRWARGWFWTLLPFVAGLWASTIYLRHHYTVDLFAGFALAPLAMWVAPRVDGWWAERQRARGYQPARGAGSAAGEVRRAGGVAAEVREPVG
jgi:membrane-associated phospholipid phosphatase